jgi:hypothetical protein
MRNERLMIRNVSGIPPTTLTSTVVASAQSRSSGGVSSHSTSARASAVSPSKTGGAMPKSPVESVMVLFAAGAIVFAF